MVTEIITKNILFFYTRSGEKETCSYTGPFFSFFSVGFLQNRFIFSFLLNSYSQKPSNLLLSCQHSL